MIVPLVTTFNSTVLSLVTNARSALPSLLSPWRDMWHCSPRYFTISPFCSSTQCSGHSMLLTGGRGAGSLLHNETGLCNRNMALRRRTKRREVSEGLLSPPAQFKAGKLSVLSSGSDGRELAGDAPECSAWYCLCRERLRTLRCCLTRMLGQ